MQLLPSEQTVAQLDALNEFVRCSGFCQLSEPCNCGTQIRHNNGGNYHDIIEFKMDSGKCWRMQTSTSDYAPDPDWQEVGFSEAFDEICRLAARGWYNK